MILARHAESLYWTGRYLERAEVTSRWLDVASRFSAHVLPDDRAAEWRGLTQALGAPQLGADLTGDSFDQSAVSTLLLADPSTVGSVSSAIQALRDNLRVVRDRVPVELWEEVNRLHFGLEQSVTASRHDQAYHLVSRTVREGCQAISGVLSESMMRDEGHAFIVIGQMIERSILTVGLLRSALTNSDTSFDSDRVLRSSSALQSYRRLHGHRSSDQSVVSFLLRTPELPRSVLSCLLNAERRLNVVDPGSQRTSQTRQLAGRIRSGLEFGDFEQDFEAQILSLLTTLQQDLWRLGDTLSSEIFRPLGEPLLHAQYIRPGLER